MVNATQKSLKSQKSAYLGIEKKFSIQTISINKDIDSKMKLKDIALKYGINYNTFRKYVAYYKYSPQTITGGTSPPIVVKHQNIWNKMLLNVYPHFFQRTEKIDRKRTFHNSKKAKIGYYYLIEQTMDYLWQNINMYFDEFCKVVRRLGDYYLVKNYNNTSYSFASSRPIVMNLQIYYWELQTGTKNQFQTGFFTFADLDGFKKGLNKWFPENKNRQNIDRDDIDVTKEKKTPDLFNEDIYVLWIKVETIAESNDKFTQRRMSNGKTELRINNYIGYE